MSIVAGVFGLQREVRIDRLTRRELMREDRLYLRSRQRKLRILKQRDREQLSSIEFLRRPRLRPALHHASNVFAELRLIETPRFELLRDLHGIHGSRAIAGAARRQRPQNENEAQAGRNRALPRGLRRVRRCGVRPRCRPGWRSDMTLSRIHRTQPSWRRLFEGVASMIHVRARQFGLIATIYNIAAAASYAAPAGDQGIWKAIVPPRLMSGEFGGLDPIGVAAGARIKADCSLNWVNPDDGKRYCFASGTSLQYFLDRPNANIERARKGWEKLHAQSR